MKALTLTQPWASLMANRSKKIETRGWYTSYRGDLVIHAAKNYPVAARNFAWQPEFRTALGWDLDLEKLPTAVGLCIVRLRACVRTDELHKVELITGQKPSAEELHFGDYSPGRYAWITEFLRPLTNQTTVKGALGLWEFPDILLEMNRGETAEISP